MNNVQYAKKNWTKPKHFDNNLIVIGGGSGGLVSAYIAAAVKAKVTLIENTQMGGDCLNTGCVPSKALIRSAKFLADISRSQEFGVKHAEIELDFADIMARVHTIIQTIAPHDSIERYQALGVNVVHGTAKFISPWAVEVKTEQSSEIITSRAIIIATGAKPYIPAIPGLESLPYLTSENLWQLQQLPKRLLILGGGPIGCELAQAFCRFGSEVTLVEKQTRLLIREDQEVSTLINEKFQQEGIKVLLKHEAIKFTPAIEHFLLLTKHHDQEFTLPFDQVIVALGRASTLDGFGADVLNLALTPNHTLSTDAFQATNYSNIFAVGDVCGPYQFTHVAAHQAWYASVNALFGQFKKFRTDYRVIPWATFIDPEVARVGLNEQEANAQGILYELSHFDLKELDRAITDSATQGFIKVLTVPGKDRILGVTIVGEHAGDLLAEFVLAMKHNLGLNKILNTIHLYPTMAEANKYVAGTWKRQHAPKLALALLEHFHHWRRN